MKHFIEEKGKWHWGIVRRRKEGVFLFVQDEQRQRTLKTFQILILVVASIFLQCWGEEYAPNNSCLFPIASVQFLTVVVVLCRILQCPVL